MIDGLDAYTRRFENNKLPYFTVLLSQEFVGNLDEDTVVYHNLNPPIRARYIRFRPVVWNNGVSMRVELYGCHGGRRFLFLLSKNNNLFS